VEVGGDIGEGSCRKGHLRGAWNTGGRVTLRIARSVGQQAEGEGPLCIGEWEGRGDLGGD
jgi:hypothetical protein